MLNKIVFITVAIFFINSNVFAESKNNLYAIIDSISGNVEIQRAKTKIWQKAENKDKIFNNDIIRCNKNSYAYISWEDGSISYINENTQLMVSFYNSNESKAISRHVTVFFGAVFFVIKEILPSINTKPYDNKIFTPTSVISIRGTSFAVIVNKESKKSEVIMINGTTMVKNINGNSFLYLGAGFKTNVDSASDTIKSIPILDKDIAEIKKWVPDSVVEKEMKIQLTKAARDKMLISGKSKEKILIFPFTNNSSYKGKWKLEKIIPEIIKDRLISSYYSAEFLDSNTSEPFLAAKKINAKLIILGEILDFNITQQAQVTPQADKYYEYYLAKVSIKLQIIDVNSNKTIINEIFYSDKKGENVKENSFDYISKMNFNLSDSKFSSSILGIAISDVIDKAYEKLINTLSAY